MDIIEEILKKYEEFATFLKNIHIEDWKKQYSRKELMEFEKKLDNIKIRSLSYEIRKLVEEMKKEEYPELLGVHHYPELREIDFMSEEQKIQLDKYLLLIGKGNTIPVWRLRKFCRQTDKLLAFLLEKGILEKVYYIVCPYHNHILSKQLTLDECNEFKEIVQSGNEAKLYDEWFDRKVFSYCDSCEDIVDFSVWKDGMIREDFILAKDRDTSLDNV